MVQATSRDRFLAILRGDAVDAPFLWESGLWLKAVERWRREGLAPGADPFEVLGLERVAYSGVDLAPDPPLAERVIADEGDTLLVEIEGGAMLRRHKHEHVPGSAQEPLEERIRYAVRDRRSWRVLKGRLDPTSKRRKQAFEPFLRGQRLQPPEHSGCGASFHPDDGFPIVLSMMTPSYWLVRNAGFERTALMLYDDPPLVEEIYEHWWDFLARQLEFVLARRVPDAVILNEGSAANRHGPFMAPQMYRRLACPGLTRLAGLCRAAGVQFVFVNCGGNAAQLVPLWKDAGLTGLKPLDHPTDVYALCSDYPDLAMIGGIMGWKQALIVFFVAPIFGAVVGIIVLLRTRDHHIPYGPFLSIATVVVMLWGDLIIKALGLV